MDGGNQNMNGYVPPYFNAIEREILGLCTPVKITDDGTYALEPVHLNGQAYRIDTDNDDEYYLIECRSGEEWDQGIGGNGMLIYHIDQSSRSAGWSDSYSKELTASDRWARYNEVNCRPDHQCADLIEADSRQDAFSDSELDFTGIWPRMSTGYFSHILRRLLQERKGLRSGAARQGYSP